MADLIIDRLGPTRRPLGPPSGYQRWRQLLFLHWPIPAAALRALIPSPLEIDTFEGQAWIGVVPFTMEGVRPRGLPAVRAISNFHELNVRTYVHVGGRDPGVWFFSLDAANGLAVRIARAFWHLPYFKAVMNLEASGSEVRYTSERRWPEPTPASFACRYTVGERLSPAAPGTFEHFLVERYLLYADAGRAGIQRGQVHHTPYPLQSASVAQLEHDLFEKAGLPAPEGAPHVLWSPGVDVEVFGLKPVLAR
jgi:uncharacterized protein YqjF (DUF2071 family)